MNHMQLYDRWLSHSLEDADLIAELEAIKGKDDEIFDRFYRDLSFGTAGLRGVLGAGTNRMNIYTVRRATQGLANYLNAQAKHPTVAISYDSRIKSDRFSKEAAGVLAANGIHVYIYRELMPVPALSFATRALKCDAGIMVTASHNPAKYNGYKVYGCDGCQMTENAADAVLAQINSLDLTISGRWILSRESTMGKLNTLHRRSSINSLKMSFLSRSIRASARKPA